MPHFPDSQSPAGPPVPLGDANSCCVALQHYRAGSRGIFKPHRRGFGTHSKATEGLLGLELGSTVCGSEHPVGLPESPSWRSSPPWFDSILVQKEN